MSWQSLDDAQTVLQLIAVPRRGGENDTELFGGWQKLEAGRSLVQI